MIPLSTHRRAQRGVTSKVSVQLAEANRRAKKASTLLSKLHKQKGIVEPKDTIPLQKEIRAMLAVGVAASNMLGAIHA